MAPGWSPPAAWTRAEAEERRGGFEGALVTVNMRGTEKHRFKFGAAAGLVCSLLLGMAQVSAQQPRTATNPVVASATNPELQVMVDGRRTALTLAEFKDLPHKTVSYHNAHTKTDETYSGVPLIDLLAKYGAPTGDKLHGKALSDYIVATGSDGYRAVLALAETDPSFHPGDVIVADSMNGQPLDAKNGPFKLVVTEDKRPARSVRNLVSIELKATV
ncbi:hypothetical protein ACPOL_5114 [Acidisarcina polymorpha]|uniref:Oxidoreductase molybdopterin-binding domain-containing protein n=1 Tax=Acidisarcina polymorpha TaxID=2211140 RepID=A0A2Z5G5W1_9BACT|nr:molybdopterin-dependent oxidoreductase [Acidisarcina polymorpha]AXC14370.1 hypothetical protein ACPOL_5114 [Acidisarcina polymorpha]